MVEGSYDPSALQTSPKDMVRFLIRDTTDGKFMVGDDEITGIMAMFTSGDALSTAIILVQLKLVELAGSMATTVSLGDATVSIAEGSEHWRRLGAWLETLKAKLGLIDGMRGPGGVAWADVPHIFQIAQHDSPGTTTSVWSSEVDRLDRR